MNVIDGVDTISDYIGNIFDHIAIPNDLSIGSGKESSGPNLGETKDGTKGVWGRTGDVVSDCLSAGREPRSFRGTTTLSPLWIKGKALDECRRTPRRDTVPRELVRALAAMKGCGGQERECMHLIFHESRSYPESLILFLMHESYIHLQFLMFTFGFPPGRKIIR